MILRSRDFLLTTEEVPRDLLVSKRLGIVHTSTVATTGILKDFMAGIRDLFSGGWKGYQEEIDKVIAACIEDLIVITNQQGGNAILGLRIEVRPAFTEKNKMFFVSVYGTACRVEKQDGFSEE